MTFLRVITEPPRFRPDVVGVAHRPRVSHEVREYLKQFGDTVSLALLRDSLERDGRTLAGLSEKDPEAVLRAIQIACRNDLASLRSRNCENSEIEAVIAIARNFRKEVLESEIGTERVLRTTLSNLYTLLRYNEYLPELEPAQP